MEQPRAQGATVSHSAQKQRGLTKGSTTLRVRRESGCTEAESAEMRGIAGASRKGIQFKYYARLAERVNDTNLRLTGQLARALRCTQSGAAYGFRRCTSKVDITRVGAASRRILQHSTEDGAVLCRYGEASGNASGQAGRRYSLH